MNKILNLCSVFLNKMHSADYKAITKHIQALFSLIYKANILNLYYLFLNKTHSTADFKAITKQIYTPFSLIYKANISRSFSATAGIN